MKTRHLALLLTLILAVTVGADAAWKWSGN